MKRRVIVVDDSLSAIRQLTKVLEEIGGYEVVGTAQNGSEGVKLYQALAPDLVLMDVVMPGMDGLECLRTLARLDPQVSVVIVSSVGGVQRKTDEALRLGAKGVINKPFETDFVRAVLNATFGEE